MTSVRDVTDACTGNGGLLLAEQPAIKVLESLGWTHDNLHIERLSMNSRESRESEHQVELVRWLPMCTTATSAPGRASTPQPESSGPKRMKCPIAGQFADNSRPDSSSCWSIAKGNASYDAAASAGSA